MQEEKLQNSGRRMQEEEIQKPQSHPQQNSFGGGGFGLGFGERPKPRPRGQGYNRNWENPEPKKQQQQQRSYGGGFGNAQRSSPQIAGNPNPGGIQKQSLNDSGDEVTKLDEKINDMQQTLDTDYTMSRVTKMQMRRDLNKLRAQRNRLSKKR